MGQIDIWEFGVGIALEGIASLYLLLVLFFVQNRYLRVLVKLIQVGDWFRGQRPLHVFYLRTVETSTVIDRLPMSD